MAAKPPRSYDTITDLILAHGYTLKQINGEDHFVRPSQSIFDQEVSFSVSELQKHTPTTFYQKAIARGWFTPSTN